MGLLELFHVVVDACGFVVGVVDAICNSIGSWSMCCVRCCVGLVGFVVGLVWASGRLVSGVGTLLEASDCGPACLLSGLSGELEASGVRWDPSGSRWTNRSCQRELV